MNFQAIHDQAHAAGHAAATGMTPTPMVVGTAIGFSNQLDRTKPTYLVEDGVCGFAWVAFAGNTAWGRWAKKAGIARAHYPKGLCVWVRDYNQSMQRKEAYATAYAQVLRDNGIDAYPGSRMD